MKIALGVLMSHGFPVPGDFVITLVDVMTHLMTGECNKFLPERLHVTGVSVLWSRQFPPNVARNELCRKALERGDDYLFFMDADMTFPADVVTRLLQHDKPVITGRYHARNPPHNAIAYVKHPLAEGPHCYKTVHFANGCVEIERGGAGALLIRRDVLEGIRFHEGDNWFQYQRGPDEPHDFTVSEDFWFYRKAREAGFPCWLDWDTECGHLQSFVVGGQHYQGYLNRQIEELPNLSDEDAARIVSHFVARGFPDGVTLASGHHVPAHELQPGER